MKIAIVGPSPVPYTMGGAENLMWGLCNAINQLTEHQAELIKLPVKEFDFWDLVESYYQFYTLDLTHFDCIIMMKYPSWMVSHPNSICYMMHTLRGLYDTYHLMNLPLEVKRGSQKINYLLDYMEKKKNPESLDEFFSLLFEMKGDSEIPNDYFSFPGPLIRLIIHYMDSWALKRNGVKKYFAISNTVKNRKDYFPFNAMVNIIYPPSTLSNGSCSGYEYIFMVSRLDGPKRIDMLIKAMRYVKSNIQLFIAGTGPEKDKLVKLAQKDQRIHFLGYIKDEEIEQYYANCLVVPYFPYDEDYGYITIEAMLHKKPVITTVDAGGPTEFVKDGWSGYVTSYDAKAIAAKIDFFAQHPEEARRQGENGYKLVKKITWKNVVEKMFTEEPDDIDQKKEKVTVISTFAIYPPLGGGQVRCYHLYKNLAQSKNVEIVSFDEPNKSKECLEIAPNMIEIKVPRTEAHQKEQIKMERKVKIPLTDICMIDLSGLTPEYGRTLQQSIETSNYVIISHPYLYPEVKKYLGNRKLIYEAQDVEYKIKKEMLPNTMYSRRLLKQIYDVEKACCEDCQIIMTCSEEDRVELCSLYSIPMEKVIVVPNGVDCSQTVFVPVQQRLRYKEEMGLSKEKIGLFMGSWHQPNLEACEYVFKFAKKCPDVIFLLMGSQCEFFRNKKIPDNVGLLGVVSEEEKNRVFSAVDFALNPMVSGSGTNLKMFDYMSAGIPVITTMFGARGIERKDIFQVCEIEEMVEYIQDFSLEDYESQVELARNYMETVYDWSVISKQMENIIF